ncbi:MAG: MarR family transcriptional regulator [Oxalobacteraceae bacterium]|nr:MarR family transcriptional regulator [Oxalobacteraceae bacterium]
MTSTNSPLDLGGLPDLVGYHLRMAQVMVFRDFDRELSDLDITPAIFGVLEILRRNQGLTQTRLAQAIGLDRSSLVPLLDKLQKRNVVEREASIKDRRSNHLHLTAAGEQLLVEAERRVRLHEKRILARLTKSETRQLIQLLMKLAKNDA